MRRPNNNLGDTHVAEANTGLKRARGRALRCSIDNKPFKVMAGEKVRYPVCGVRRA
jgi:hypothetical protein